MIMIEGTRNSCTLLAGLWFETFGTYTLRSTSTKMRNQNGCVSSFRAFPLPPSNKISVLRGVSFVDPNLAKHSIDRDQKESNKTNLHTQGLREEGTVNSIQVNSIQAATTMVPPPPPPSAPPKEFPYDYLFKVLVIGDASVGKVSQFLSRKRFFSIHSIPVFIYSLIDLLIY
jgi:hypothetical protein